VARHLLFRHVEGLGCASQPTMVIRKVRQETESITQSKPAEHVQDA
jgi:hypothetical protein